MAKKKTEQSPVVETVGQTQEQEVASVASSLEHDIFSVLEKLNSIPEGNREIDLSKTEIFAHLKKAESRAKFIDKALAELKEEERKRKKKEKKEKTEE